MGLFNNNEEKLNDLLAMVGNLDKKLSMIDYKLDKLSPDDKPYKLGKLYPDDDSKEDNTNSGNNYNKLPVKVIRGSEVKIYPTVSSAVLDLNVPYSRARKHMKTIEGYRVINTDTMSLSESSKFGGIPITTYKSGNVVKKYPSKSAIIDDLDITRNTLDHALKNNNKGYFIDLEDLEKPNNMVNFV